MSVVCERPTQEVLDQVVIPEERCGIIRKSHKRLRSLCVSCPAGPEEEEALGAAAHPDRRHALHHRVPEGGSGELAHQHRGPEEHGLCCQGHEAGPREHVRTPEQDLGM